MAGIDLLNRRRRVLIVEDDALVSDVVVAALEDDFETSLVETLAAALECLSRGGIDLVLLDCTLPDGVHANLIPSADRSGVPIVLMSGDPQRIEKLCAEVRPCIVKPFTLTGLLDVVQREISRTTPIAA